ncbi:cadherin-23-like [Glandiceps talaboti]
MDALHKTTRIFSRADASSMRISPKPQLPMLVLHLRMPILPLGCGENYILNRSRSVTIESPNYPNNYPNNAWCEWFIEASDYWRRIRVEWEEFSTDSCGDYVSLGYGDIIGENVLIDQHSGSCTPNPMMYNYHKLWMTFVSDAFGQQRGFRVRMRDSDPEQNSEYCHISPCGFVTVESPSYPELYPNNTRFLWRINAYYTRRINVSWSDFNTEEGYDFVSVGNGHTPDMNVVIDRHSGDSLPENFISDSNELWVTFVSDHIITDTGFSVDMYDVGTLCNCTCGGVVTIDGYTNYVTSPNFPCNYTNDASCVWIIYASNPSRRLHIGWNYFDTEPVFDVVSAGHGDEVGKNVVINQHSGNTYPDYFYSDANSVWITFETNEDITFQGFRIYINEACGESYNLHRSENIDIMSPNYPDDYPNNARCEWFIEASDYWRNIYVRWEDFATEPCADFISLGYGDTVGANVLIDQHSGSVIPRSFHSGHDKLWMRFASDEVGVCQGFKVHMEDTASPCEEYLTISQCGSVNVTSPNYPNNYSNYLTCRWIITTLPSRSIFVEWLDFETEEYFDFVSAGHGNELWSDVVIANHSGSSLPKNFKSGDTVWLTFTTDGSITYRGFQVILHDQDTVYGHVSKCGSKWYIFEHLENLPDYYHPVGNVTSENPCFQNPCQNATYQIIEEDAQGYFIVDDIGFIWTQTNDTGLDRESIDKHTFTVRTEGCQMIKDIPVHVNVLDVNDNYPVFDPTLYFTETQDGTPADSIIEVVYASDADIDVNGDITYTITPPFDIFFHMDSNILKTSIQLFVRTFREFLDIIDGEYILELEINGTDNGFYSKSAVIPATVFITLVPNILPGFQNTSFQLADVYENEDSGSYVTTLLSILSMNMTSYPYYIDYQFAGTVEEFTIDSLSGDVSTTRPLDREERDMYHYVVIGSINDENLCLSNQVAEELVITVLDVNDHTPQFRYGNSTGSVDENSPPNTFILMVPAIEAMDKDDGFNADILYSLSGDGMEQFSIDGKIGVVMTTDDSELLNLDHESRDLYELNVTATDQNGTGFHSNIPIVIQINDVNDNQPYFLNTAWNFECMENTSIGLSIGLVAAEDEDSGINERITYFIASRGEDVKFGIEPETGDIYVRSELDRELKDSYTFDVVAIDGGDVRLCDDSTVTITILDVNDNKPEFESCIYSYGIPEDYAIGSYLDTVIAVDLDIGSNGEVRYSVDTYDFIINETTVIATDNGEPALTSSTLVEVNIWDINDNAPQFIYDNFEIVIPDGMSPNVPLVVAYANDSDSRENGFVSYSLHGNASYWFYVDVIGVIYASMEISYSEMHDLQLLDSNDTLQLVVIARDHGYELQQENNRIVYVTVKQLTISGTINNGGNRTFENTSVSENRPNGTFVTTVTAEGLDMYDILYEFAESDVYDFAIDETTVIAELLINVLDENDNAPVFNQNDNYTGYIIENQMEGTVLKMDTPIETSDPDNGFNASIVYMLSGEGSEDFLIDNRTGVITSSVELDRETWGSYVFDVIAADRDGVDELSLNTSMPLTVIVLDDNDHHPQFEGYTQIYDILENETVGYVIDTISASDEDLGRNAEISYSIVSGDYGMFDIGHTSGQLTVIESLDREVTAAYTLNISAYDQGYPIRLGNHMEVLVNLTDVNDNRPMFTQDTYLAIQQEEVANGTNVLPVTAHDPDEGLNGEVAYSITSSDFYIDSKTGDIFSMTRLDFEDKRWYEFEVHACDHGNPSLCSSSIVTIRLTDINDNAPTFHSDLYESTILDKMPADYPVLVLNACDEDSGNNGKFCFTILDDVTELFDVDCKGVIRLNSDVNYTQMVEDEYLDSNDSIQFTVVVEDFGDPSLQSNTSVTIKVKEYQCTGTIDDPGSRTFENVSVLENRPNDTFVTTVTAEGLDMYDILYAFAESDVYDFAIDKTTVIAELLINVLDENDNAPVFNQNDNYTGYIVENQMEGTVLKMDTPIETSDPDNGFNASIVYMLSGDGSEYFLIDNRTGVITSTVELDRETWGSYVFDVIAADRDGVDELSLHTSMPLTVIVLDDNDHHPQFEGYTQIYDILENETVGYVIDTISVSDEDLGRNAEISYFIVSGDYGMFDIGHTSGQLTVIESLDREVTAAYTLNISAHDQGYPIRLGNHMEVLVNLTDVNDNRPMFTQDTYLAIQQEEVANGTNVLSVTAHDPDEGLNGEVAYSITSSDFYIDSKTGDIFSMTRLDFEDIRSYGFEVHACDHGNPSLCSSSNVTIRLTDINDNAPTFHSNPYESTILDGMPADYPVLVLNASDEDSGNNGQFCFTILDDITELIDADCEGVIRLNSDVNYTQMVEDEYLDSNDSIQFTVVVEDFGDPSLQSNTSVTIKIKEYQCTGTVDDPGSRTFENVSVLENRPNDTFVTAVTAEGLDMYDILYEFAESDVYDFAIDKTTVIAELLINVLDENDNAPVFNQNDNYTGYIVENQMEGTVLKMDTPIETSDPDNGFNASIVYMLSGEGSEDFLIDNRTGVITSTVELDRETWGSYVFDVIAADRDGVDKLSLNTSVPVTVIVLDDNDHHPQFEGYTQIYDILENVTIGYVIDTISASDEDLGRNAEISYSIVSGDYGMFDIGHTSGQLTVIESLDREVTAAYTLNISAHDQGYPIRLGNHMEVLVNLTDVNDNRPMFTQDTYLAIQQEEVANGTNVLSVTANDPDEGLNGEVDYSTSSSDFYIDSGTGDIFSMTRLDFEGIRWYEFEGEYLGIHNSNTDDLIITIVFPKQISFLSLSVHACDHGNPSLCSSSIVTIRLTDINDNAPTFHSDPYESTILDKMPADYPVLVLNACDEDSGNNGKFCFTILDDVTELFDVDCKGVIRLNSDVNYTQMVEDEYLDSNDSIQFTVVVEDFGDPSLQSNTSVTIKVKEYQCTEESTPEPWDGYSNTSWCGSKWYQFEVEEHSPANTIIGDVSDEAFDKYNVDYDIYEDNAKDFFTVNENGQILTLDDNIDRETNETITFNVIINGIIVTKYVPVHVTVLDINDHYPEFSPPLYQVQTLESLPGDSIIEIVYAHDPDAGENGTLTYSVTPPENSYFFMDNTANVMKNCIALDIKDMMDQGIAFDNGIINISITVKDGGNNFAERNAVVMVDIIENKRETDRDIMNETVAENMKADTYVATVEATGYEGYQLKYSFARLNVTDFEIDETSGKVTTRKVLDREHRENYLYEIIAYIEEGPTCLVNPVVADLYITVLDENDNPPTFTHQLYTGEIKENSPPNTPVSMTHDIIANDPDKGINASIKYELSGDGDDQFEIDEITGVITAANITNLNLDRETKDTYSLIVTAHDRNGIDDLSLNSSADVTVKLSDMNDNYPQFTQSSYSYEVYENVTKHYTIATICATDDDIDYNAKVQYSIVSGNDGNFDIGRDTGILTVIDELDRETVANYILNVSANDQGEPSLSNFTDVFIRLIDVNDNDPTFEKTSYIEYQEEEAECGTSVFTINAVDPDEGSNGKVIYTLAGTTDFKIDEETGEIVTNTVLDYEIKSHRQHEFEVTAKDGGTPARSSTTNVIIHITDINDNPPNFTQPTYTQTIEDGEKADHTVLGVSANDPDCHECHGVCHCFDNSRVSYLIVDDKTQLFQIDDIGLISLTEDIDYDDLKEKGYLDEKDTLHFKVVARDHGLPSLNDTADVSITVTKDNTNILKFEQSLYQQDFEEEQAKNTCVLTVKAEIIDSASFETAEGNIHYAFSHQVSEFYIEESTVNINITDINDNAPVFISTTYTMQVVEHDYSRSDVPHAHLGKVTATDADIGDNGTISYSIVDGNEGDVFNINITSGDIFAVGLIDRETIDTYDLTVMAKDNGANPLNSTAKVAIEVLDVNDNHPQFSRPFYNGSVKENTREDKPIVTVEAHDLDNGENGTVEYKIIEGNDGDNFEIKHNGNINPTANANIDYETTANYNLTVQARDQGDPPLSNTTQVYIMVIDLNDNTPYFVNEPYAEQINVDHDANTPILTVTACDADSGDNARILYTISGGNDDDGDFTIDGETGVITVSTNVSMLDPKFVTLLVNATDHGQPPLSNQTQVNITIKSLNNFAPQFHANNYSAEICEDVNSGTEVLRVTATDNDTDEAGQLYYEILTGNDNGFFQITTDRDEIGIISTNGIIDREIQELVNLVIAAYDKGLPQKNDTATVDIRLLDVNDNPPVMSPKQMKTRVAHDSPNGTFVINVNATDPDIVGELTYSIASDPSQSYMINETTGVIITRTEFNMEDDGNEHTIIVRVDDTLHFDEAYVHTAIFYNDPNQHAPQFTKDRYETEVLESLPVGSNLTDLDIKAYDKDSGQDGEVTYSLAYEGNDRSIFTIEPITAIISTEYKLEPHQTHPFYNLTAIATDNGTVPKTSTVPVDIVVIPIPDTTEEPDCEGDNDVCDCGTFKLLAIIALAALVLILVIIISIVAYKKKKNKPAPSLKSFWLDLVPKDPPPLPERPSNSYGELGGYLEPPQITCYHYDECSDDENGNDANRPPSDYLELSAPMQPDSVSNYEYFVVENEPKDGDDRSYLQLDGENEDGRSYLQLDGENEDGHSYLQLETDNDNKTSDDDDIDDDSDDIGGQYLKIRKSQIQDDLSDIASYFNIESDDNADTKSTN